MIRIRDIDHLVLRIVDLPAMLRFYCEVLGCTVERRQDSIGLVQLRAGRSLIDLVPLSGALGRAGGAAPGRQGRNLDHFCVRVDPFDAEAIGRHLRAHGIRPGEVARRNGAEGEGPSIYIDDPEGNVVELKGPPDMPAWPPALPSALAETSGPRIRLRLLARDDADALVRAAADGQLWQLPTTVVPSTHTVGDYIDEALRLHADGTAVPYAIALLESGRVIGSTRLWKIDLRHRRLEIGSSWLAASMQRGFANGECKYLMLCMAIDTLQCVRVQFTTDENNAPSRAAILRLGAREEGLIRHERIMPDGRKRNSVRYSLVDDDWPAVKAHLEQRLRRP
jgi:RimJ/RimL family protein N-acetyltransferase/catechol 2,3-dioxygenase-like lactoylglutathione lyase family enzyme